MNFIQVKNTFRNRKHVKIFLDERNKKLWKDIIKTENVSISFGDFQNYGVFSLHNTHRIDVQQNNIDIPSFTHELLHVYLAKLNINIGTCLKIMSWSNEDTQRIFSNSLIDNLGNYLDHIKMLPLFLKMGFKKEEFIADYYSERVSDFSMRLIELTYRDNSVIGVQNFIGNYFSVKACPNTDRDYTEFYNHLKKLDLNLFDILEKFHDKWKEYDISNPYAVYNTIVTDFLEKIKDWAFEKPLL